MTTSYILSIGYLSGYSYRGGYDAAWQQLRTAAQSIAEQPELIAEEARKFEAPEWCCDKHCSHLMDWLRTNDPNLEKRVRDVAVATGASLGTAQEARNRMKAALTPTVSSNGHGTGE